MSINMKKIILYFVLLVSFIGFSQVQNSLLSVQGKNLVDPCGQNIILKGVNHGNVWAINWGLTEMPQIAQTGANTVRICLETTWVNWAIGGVTTTTSGANLEPIIQACLANKMIPIVEIHDFTQLNANLNATQSLPLATNFWIRNDIITILKKYQNWLILNIANEPEHYDTTEAQYYQANKTAVLALRNAGLDLPIMIDGYGWANEHDFFTNYAVTLQNDDPLHKLIFSIHAYWENISDATMLSRFQAINAINVPIVFGEIAKSLANATPTINYQYLMQLCTTYNKGFIAWWWGFTNPGSNNVLSMTPTGLYSGLTDFGSVIAVTDQNSIQNTAVRPYKLVNGVCSALANQDFEFKNNIKLFPNPAKDFLTIQSKINIENIDIYDTNGRLLYQLKQNTENISLNLDFLATGIYSIKISNQENSFTQKFIKN
jgi:mannan endo-1,4-beta-mannosidase